jgi:hypothetical protein
MPVTLTANYDPYIAPEFERWFAIDGDALPHRDLKPMNLSARLEQAFNAEAATWIELARKLGDNTSAGLSHFAAVTPNNSDFGALLAWSRVVAELAAEAPVTLVLCNDPWLFRHLAALPGVTAASPPPLWLQRAIKFLRGYAARTRATLRLIGWHLALRTQGQRARVGGPAILVYGHPRSRPDGFDGYFGDLLVQMPEITRALHVDCPPDRARALAADGGSVSLHAWGSVAAALALPFAKWRPTRAERDGKFKWLLDRACVMEGSTGQAATIAWQNHCQKRWLAAARPSAVVWPWENQSWERQFVRDAKVANVATIGYQHTVVGPQLLNHSPRSNADGTASLPERIFCNGPSTMAQLKAYGIEESRMKIAGALRFPIVPRIPFVSDGPVFVALPFNLRTARQIIDMARALAGKGFHFLIKSHPLSPCSFKAEPGLTATDQPLHDHGGLRAIIYAGTTVGLEAILAGLPAIRFMPHDHIAIDILPDGVHSQNADADGMEAALRSVVQPAPVDKDYVFSDVPWALWQEELRHA